jgi:hypothetical protein
VYPYINAGLYTPIQTDIQDLGFTEEFDSVGVAPTDGWSTLGYSEAILGHTYVVWTGDENFAKVWITSISPSGMIAFRWAFQTVPNNIQLAPPARPVHDEQWGQPKPSTKTSQLIK